MAKSLVYVEVTKQHLERLASIPPIDVAATKATLADIFSLEWPNAGDLRQAIVLDLHFHTLAFAREQSFTPEKTSALMSIFKANHVKAVTERLVPERSFALFKSLMLAHSVQRPPYSTAVFSLADLKAVTDYAIGSYYAHYKLYQYAYTTRIDASVTTRPVLHELPPTAVRSLGSALNEAGWAAHLAELERIAAEEAAEAARVAAEQAEADREAALQAAFEAAVPDEVTRKVEAELSRRMPGLQAAMEAQFAAQTAELQAKLAALGDGLTAAVKK